VVSRIAVPTRKAFGDQEPERFSDYPEATHVLGQPDFTTLDTGPGRKHFPRGGELLIDDEHQRLFVEDRTRILVFNGRGGKAVLELFDPSGKPLPAILR